MATVTWAYSDDAVYLTIQLFGVEEMPETVTDQFGNVWTYDSSTGLYTTAGGTLHAGTLGAFDTNFPVQPTVIRSSLQTGLPIPSAIKGVPQRIWSRPTYNSDKPPFLSYHIDQMRWCILWVYLESRQPPVEIPLLDSQNRPVFTAETPPLVTCRRAVPGAYSPNHSDSVGAAWKSGSFYETEAIRSAHGFEFQTNYHPVHWSIYPNTNPVPHWICRASFDDCQPVNNPYRMTLRFDFLGTGTHVVDELAGGDARYGHTKYGYGVGSANEIGRYKWILPWEIIKFNDSGPVAETLNDRAFARAAVDVEHNATPPFTYREIYLTTAGGGYGDGEANADPIFGNPGGGQYDHELPMVFVLAEKTDTLKALSAETTWQPWSFGMNFDSTAYTDSVSPTNDTLNYFNFIRGGTNGKIIVSIANAGSNGLPKTFYIYAVGRRY
jgi:hypothetical protein